MSDKIKVYNYQKFNVGVVTLDRPNGFNIRPNSFALMSNDDIEYVMSISTLFDRGILRIEEAASDIVLASGIDTTSNAAFMDDDEIKQKLKQSAASQKKWIADIEEEYVLDKIYDIAIGLDLPQSKLSILKKKMPEKEFIDE